ncbi:ATP-binding SpoIIE family protein phosphatase [Oceanobacter mangrovi]|uniref:ATP-binding SpoIIE family protein phosphatase n=1 Tax=Oceanobacter mangrovi TaxID=2862510 RepID=UPI001C8EB082|nr:fused response regulator/phosphatase [Oceanobacter mangrovi]
MSSVQILIADDNQVDRKILGRILQKQGHRVIEAVNGREAVELYRQHLPEMVLLDVMMPEMDGKQAALQIKDAAGEDFVPIIFLTSLTDAYGLAECLDSGGDDFLNKPYNPVVLEAKVHAFFRMREMHYTLQQQRDTIARHNEHMMREQEAAKAVFDNVAHQGCLSADNIRYLVSPLAIFNGDVLLAARQPNGSMNLLLGDFTGHGLPAAIGAMPLAEIFYGMTNKGYGVRDIVREINFRLKQILPVGFFCCAVMVEMNFERKTASLWMGGVPDCYLYRQQTDKLEELRSSHLPLGVLSDTRFRDSLQEFNLANGDRFLLWSDGILEARNPAGEMFGQPRLFDVISTAASADDIFPAIRLALDEYQGDSARDDDITLAEICMVEPPEQTTPEIDRTLACKNGPMDWSFEYRLGSQSLANFNPLPVVMHVLSEVPGLKMMSGQLYTVLSELFSNAFEHGVLELDSALKQTPAGFTEYYRQRGQRIAELQQGQVKIHLEHQGDGLAGLLRVRFEDSGPGFDYQAMLAANAAALQQAGTGQYSGRGIPLIHRICESVEYLGKGNVVEAVIHWPIPATRA